MTRKVLPAWESIRALLLIVGVGLASLRCGGGESITVPEDPFIDLSESIISFSGTEGAAGPAAQTVAITNSGDGTLSGLATAVSYTSGPADGWLTAELSATTAPSTLTLTATTGTLAPGAYTALVAVSSAVANNSPQSVGINLTVEPQAQGATIVLSSTSQNFTSVQGGPGPAAQTVEVSNGGGGTLAGLTADVTYPTGQAGGWLTAGLSATTAPSTLTLTAATGSLTAGNYTATVAVGSAAADNSPQTLAVAFTVVPSTAGPTISLSTNSRSLSATQGGANPGARTVEVSNGGGGTLSGLDASINYTDGQPTGWLAASLSQSTAPSTLRLTATTGALTAGTYTATVAVTSSVADNSPQTVSVRFTVTAAPQITLSSTRQTFSVLQGGENPAAHRVEVSNGGGGTLSGLTTEVSYAAAQPTGWLNADLSRATAPSTLTLTVTTGALAAGTYDASVAVRSAVASNSPRTINVTFTVQPPAAAPMIALSSTNQNFSAEQGGPDPAAQTVEVSNGGGGTLEGLRTNITYIAVFPGQPVGWMTASLSGPTAPSTLTLTVETAGLPPDTYRASVFVYSDAASNSPQPVSVIFTVTPPAAPEAPSGLVATAVSTSEISLTWTDNASNEESFVIEGCTDPACAVGHAELATVPANVTIYQSTGLAEGTTYHYRVRAYNAISGPSDWSNTASATTLASWTTQAPMPSPRFGSASGVVNGILYVVGGSLDGTNGLTTVEAYDPASNSWTTKAPMPSPRWGPAAAVMNGILYVVGGYSAGFGHHATVEAYDPGTNSWTTRQPMPTARYGAMVGVVNGLLYVAGGQGDGGYLTTVEAYDPVTNAWKSKTPLPVARRYGAGGVVAGMFYVAGGNDGSITRATVEAYDPASDTWTTKAPMPTPRSVVAGAVLNGQLYVAGGVGRRTVEAYDPLTDRWATRPEMPSPRYLAVAGVVNGVLYVAGGKHGDVVLGTLEAHRP